MNVERAGKYGNVIILQDLNLKQILVQGQMFM